MSNHTETSRGKTVVVIQARQRATRFPGKILELLGDKPVLRWVVDRASDARRVDQVVVATSDHVADDAIQYFCEKEAISVFRGPEHDVLKRYVLAAEAFGAETVVRVTADCPFLDPAVLDRVIEEYFERGVDYASNTLRYTYPDGFDCEVMSLAALKEAERNATAPSDREHVTPYLKHKNFRRHSVELSEPVVPTLRVTVDYPEDLECLSLLQKKMGKTNFGWREVVEEMRRSPEITELNAGIVVNEGYYRSLAKEPVAPLGYRYDKSMALFKEAKEIIPDASQTFSKGTNQVSVGGGPFFVEKGKGAHLWDVDGNKYIDYTMGLGPCILGYSDEDVNEAVHAQIDRLTIASLSSPLETEVARRLVQHIPCAEMVRFGKNGSDVTAAAVRIARAFTKRDQILCAGYHGWQDWYIGTTTRKLGVPKAVAALTDTFKFNDLDSLESKLNQYKDGVAAVILEPITGEAPKAGYLDEVIRLAHAHGALVIFDEVITGFRFGIGGAQTLYNVTPDLACFGKALANGYPLSTVVGRKDVMSIVEEVFFSFTMGGELASLTAAQATINKMEREPVFASIWEQGARLIDGFRVLTEITETDKWVTIQGLAPRSLINFQGQTEREGLLMKTYFQQECASRGLLFSGSHFVSYSHRAEIIDETLRVYGTVLNLLRENIGKLESVVRGAVLKPVFRKA